MASPETAVLPMATPTAATKETTIKGRQTAPSMQDTLAAPVMSAVTLQHRASLPALLDTRYERVLQDYKGEGA